MKSKFEKISDILRTQVDYRNAVKKLTEALDPEPYMSCWRSCRDDLHNALSELDLFELVRLGLEMRLAVLIGLNCEYEEADSFICYIHNKAERRLPVLQVYIICSEIANTANLNYGGWSDMKLKKLRKAAELQLTMDEINLTVPMGQRQ